MIRIICMDMVSTIKLTTGKMKQQLIYQHVQNEYTLYFLHRENVEPKPTVNNNAWEQL